MTYTREQAITEIAGELRRRQDAGNESIIGQVLRGMESSAALSLIVHDPGRWAPLIRSLSGEMGDSAMGADVAGAVPRESPGTDPAEHAIRFFLHAAACFSCYPWRWNPGARERHAADAAAAALEALEGLVSRHPGAAEAVRAGEKALALARLQAEGIENPGERTRIAEALLATGFPAYVRALAQETARSNLAQAAAAFGPDPYGTRWGNDYAAFLFYALLCGASFVTTNPVLIKLAWDIDPAYWDRRVDGCIRDYVSGGGRRDSDAAVPAICTEVTARVVAENCRLLRGIYLLSGGTDGYVSAQVNPRNHSDSGGMIAEARALYAKLADIMGGVPNVVIKLPATRAGLEAARILTGQGIGVTITLTFSCFQAEAFAKTLQQGCAPMSYIAFMSGRMAYPVRDELTAGGVEGGADAARWAGVEVARKIFRILYGDQGGCGGGSGGIADGARVKLMIASLRIYDPDTWIPDISELWGCPLLTVFPNVRRAYDSVDRKLEPGTVRNRTPEEAVQVLRSSEIFRQAWWLPGDDPVLKPRNPLSLEESRETAVAAWPPVAQTLNQFIDLYDQMSAAILARLELQAEDH